jgi:hypothetical protein
MVMVAAPKAGLATIATAVGSISLCKMEGAVVFVVVIPPLLIAAAGTARDGQQ